MSRRFDPDALAEEAQWEEFCKVLENRHTTQSERDTAEYRWRRAMSKRILGGTPADDRNN